MKFYEQDFEDQADELKEMWDMLIQIRENIEEDNPFYRDIIDLLIEIDKEKDEIEERIPKDDTNEYLTAEYWRNQL